VFSALVVTVKTLSRRIILHYFHNLSSASGGKDAQTPSGYFPPQTPNLPTPGKNPAGSNDIWLVAPLPNCNCKTILGIYLNITMFRVITLFILLQWWLFILY